MKTSLSNNLKINTLLLLLISSTVIAQESYTHKRFSLKLDYSQYRTGAIINGSLIETKGNYRLSFNYGLSKHFEGSLYAGTSYLSHHMLLNDSTGILQISNYFAPFYGGSLNYHLLPLWVDAKDFRFDIYLTGRIGGALLKTPRNTKYTNRMEYSIGTGIVFYPFDHLGLFAEFSLGEFINEHVWEKDYFKAHYGLAIKF